MNALQYIIADLVLGQDSDLFLLHGQKIVRTNSIHLSGDKRDIEHESQLNYDSFCLN